MCVYICLMLLILVLIHRQAIFESKKDRLSSSAECWIRTLEVWCTESPLDGMPTHNKLSYRGSSKNLDSIARPYD